MRRAEPEILRTVAVDDDVEIAEVGQELRSVAARVEEQPSVPFGQPSLDERELVLIERIHVEARRRAKIALESVDPRVVGTADASLGAPLTDGQELVPAVATDVVEGPEGT